MITNLHNEYQNAFAADNVYGHVISLLKNHLSSNTPDKGIHLDIGCGYAAIAEHVEDMGRIFVGIDASPKAIESLISRGFEAHCANIDAASVSEILNEIIAGRNVSSISLIDTLEHLPEGQTILHRIHDIARQNNALFVISVPNITHRDIGFKLATGNIHYTTSGLLDHTHVMMYDENTLIKVLNHSGFHVVAKNHVFINHSDQFFPRTHPALQEGTTLRKFLGHLRSRDPNTIAYQLVLASLPGEKLSELPFVNERETKRPFLSVVTRTQGKRIQNLNEFFTCMLGQSDRDFEVLVVGHKLSLDRQIAVEQIIEDLPEWLRLKTRLIRVDHGNRTHPLNIGFKEAKGEYIAIHDDDDIPFGHWVETFRRAATKGPGCILRGISVVQSVECVQTRKLEAIRSVGPYQRIYPAEFDYFKHMTENRSPNNTLAFPRGIFENLNMSFDEELTTTEDWDIILRAAMLVGVSPIPEITGSYQRLAENSSTMHDQEEWRLNEIKIVQKLNNQPLLLPAGSFAKLRSIMRQLDSTGPTAYAWPSSKKEELLQQIACILESKSWRITAPLRWMGVVLGRKRPVNMSAIVTKTENELGQILSALLSSTSWRLSQPLRQLRAK